MEAKEMRQVVEQYVAAYNRKDLEFMLELYDPDATMEDPYGVPPVRGHDAIAGLYQMGFDLGLTLQLEGSIRLAGNAAVFPLCVSAAKGKLYVIDLMEFSDAGKVQKMRAYWGPENLEGDIGI
ncbi:MAG: nuclear transport factor 2 family protein [Myxococcota bacterium]